MVVGGRIVEPEQCLLRLGIEWVEGNRQLVPGTRLAFSVEPRRRWHPARAIKLAFRRESDTAARWIRPLSRSRRPTRSRRGRAAVLSPVISRAAIRPNSVSRFSGSAAYAIRKLARAVFASRGRAQPAPQPRDERIIGRAHREQSAGLLLTFVVKRDAGP